MADIGNFMNIYLCSPDFVVASKFLVLPFSKSVTYELVSKSTKNLIYT